MLVSQLTIRLLQSIQGVMSGLIKTQQVVGDLLKQKSFLQMPVSCPTIRLLQYIQSVMGALIMTQQVKGGFLKQKRFFKMLVSCPTIRLLQPIQGVCINHDKLGSRRFYKTKKRFFFKCLFHIRTSGFNSLFKVRHLTCALIMTQLVQQ